MRRESCPADGRCQIVRIKPARRSLLNRMRPVYGAAIQHAIGDRLNDEETGILVALLGKFYKSGHERLIILLSSWYDLYAHESLVQEWRAGSIFRVAAAYSTHPHQDRGDILGQHHCEGSSGRHRGIKKRPTIHRASRVENGAPRFIWLPRMLEQPSLLRCRQDRHTIRTKGTNC